MSEKRNVRASQARNSVRDEESRPMTAWKPPSLLDAPEARPAMSKGGLLPRFRVRKAQTTCTNVCVKDGNRALLTL